MKQPDDALFDELLTAALYRAAELDMPSDEELERTVQPSPRFRRRMDALLRSPRRYIRNRRRSFLAKMMRASALGLIALGVLFGAVMAASPAVRVAVIEFGRSLFEDRTEYLESIQYNGYEFTLSYIPEGYELILRGDDEPSGTRVHQDGETESYRVYRDKDKREIRITVSGRKPSIDNEHYAFYLTTINSRAADVYEAADMQHPNIVLLYDDASGSIITLVSDIVADELIKIAEGIG